MQGVLKHINEFRTDESQFWILYERPSYLWVKTMGFFKAPKLQSH